ncbi:Universal stress protein family protein [Curtobacterium sp. 314Chir4.1]|uniref:universal stress protein n=1 Tax=Curtobacterium sp. 314Chir4.1 TaxID=1279028 RepID=UPI000BD0A142|nr:universal stress protein [Curtobacterium sp. 314Chir4.1]SOC86814.1 Universal stress protein family protein [Curtobacterium sp. 314Chir4.1]
MDERWTTVTLAADAAKPHEEAVHWITARAGTGIERIRVIGVDPALEARVGPSGRRVAEAVADAARAGLPDVQVEIRRHAGPFAAALVEESDDGDLLVIGTFRSRRGSTAGGDPARVAERAAVPTVVVPDGPHPIDGDVVLAVEEPLDERAVAIAVDEARRRHRRVTLLRAWEMPVLTRTGLTDFAEDPMRWRTRNAELLQRVTAALTRRYPEVRFHPLLVEGHPGHAIAAHTRRACLVVLGLGHVKALSGSVLHDVLRETVSPVCVVPPAAHTEAVGVSA